MNLIQQLEKEQFEKLSATKSIPEFGPGDTVIVNVKVVEGERTRVQAYEGVCIGRSGGGLNESFTVRKISYGEGVERVFPVMSPMIDSIKVVRRGKVRRAKLYYLRQQRRHRHRPARRHRRPLAAARPVLRTVRDVGDVRAYAQPDAALTPVSRAYPRLTAHTEFLLELTLMSKPTTLYDKIWNDHLVHE